MDPNATLAQIRRDVAVFDIYTDPHDPADINPELHDLVSELVDLVSGLDHWLGGGGPLPDAWTGGRTREGTGR